MYFSVFNFEEGKEYYIRTDLGAFRFMALESNLNCFYPDGSVCINGDLPPYSIKVKTLDGFSCDIATRDIQIVGLMEDFESITEKTKEIRKEMIESQEKQEFDSVKFSFLEQDKSVRINLRNSDTSKTLTISLNADDFVTKIVRELPNTVVYAIIDEQERNSLN